MIKDINPRGVWRPPKILSRTTAPVRNVHNHHELQQQPSDYIDSQEVRVEFFNVSLNPPKRLRQGLTLLTLYNCYNKAGKFNEIERIII